MEDKDLLNEIAKSLKAVAGSKEPKGLSREEEVALFKTIATDDKARTEYAKTRAAAILELIPEQSTVRKIFKTEVLAGDAQSSYPISFDYTNLASYMPKFGGNVVRVVEGDELWVPTFGIQGGVRYSMDIAKQGRLDLATMSMNSLRDNIISLEERAGWSTIKGTLSGLNTNQTVYCSGTSENFHNFTKKAINKMITQMDIQRRVLTDVYASPRSIADVKEWSNNSIDFMTQREIFQNAGLPGSSQYSVNGGNIWGLNLWKVYNSSLVSDAQAYGFDTTRFGVMPIRQEFTTYEDPVAILEWQVGILGRELVGFGVTDSWAVVSAVLDSTHAGTACSTF